MKAYRFLPVLLAFLCLVTGLSCDKNKEEDLKADFSIIKTCPTGAPCTVQFKNLATGDATFRWDFGDNTPYSNQKDPEHTYQANGTYKIVLTAQYANTSRSVEKTLVLTTLSECETKGSFSCARRLRSGVQAEDRMNGAKNNYYYFVVDTPGAISIDLDAVPGLSSERTYRVTLLSAANTSSSSVVKSKDAHGGESLSFFAGPLEQKEYYLRIEELGAHSNEPFRLTYRFLNTDLNERNETFATATPLALSQVITGTLLAKGDKDYFRFYLDQPGVVDITVDPIPDLGPNARMYAYVYSTAGGSAPVRQQYRVSGEVMKMSAGPLDSGYHYLLLDGDGNESPEAYHLSIAYDTSDRYELNNSFAKAKPVPLGQNIRATLRAPGDEDYFKFTAVANQPVTLSIPAVPAGGGTMSLYLYREPNSGDLVQSSYKGENQALGFTTSEHLLMGKTYYVRLVSNGESAQQYTLRITQ